MAEEKEKVTVFTLAKDIKELTERIEKLEKAKIPKDIKKDIKEIKKTSESLSEAVALMADLTLSGDYLMRVKSKLSP